MTQVDNSGDVCEECGGSGSVEFCGTCGEPAEDVCAECDAEDEGADTDIMRCEECNGTGYMPEDEED